MKVLRKHKMRTEREVRPPPASPAVTARRPHCPGTCTPGPLYAPCAPVPSRSTSPIPRALPRPSLALYPARPFCSTPTRPVPRALPRPSLALYPARSLALYPARPSRSTPPVPCALPLPRPSLALYPAPFSLTCADSACLPRRAQAAFFREERDVMAMSQSPWITTLHFAFQNHDHLFLVMEFLSVCKRRLGPSLFSHANAASAVRALFPHPGIRAATCSTCSTRPSAWTRTRPASTSPSACSPSSRSTTSALRTGTPPAVPAGIRGP